MLARPRKLSGLTVRYGFAGGDVLAAERNPESFRGWSREDAQPLRAGAGPSSAGQDEMTVIREQTTATLTTELLKRSCGKLYTFVQHPGRTSLLCP